MLIPIFGSCPTNLSKEQEDAKRLILGELGHAGMEWRSVGQTDYPTSSPLREVRMLAKHCCGGVILGFAQFKTKSGVWKEGTPKEKLQSGLAAFPTPWNQLEAGLLFALGLPLLVFRDIHITGGIFDNGEIFIQDMPKSKPSNEHRKTLREVIRKFGATVNTHYYSG